MSKAPTYGQMWPKYARWWDAMKLTRPSTTQVIAEKILDHKSRYQAVEKLTGVPWYWIGITHIREGDGDFRTSLAQGDRWDRVSVHEPDGRGPFRSWEEAAVDALVTLKHMDRVQDWRLEKLLFWFELYNGWGYHGRGIPSPYVWGATSVQKPGKYIADHVWSSATMDNQLGAAAMLAALMRLDPSIKPQRETAEVADDGEDIAVKPIPVPRTPVPSRTKTVGIGAGIVAAVAAVAAWADAHPVVIIGAVAMAVLAVIVAMGLREK